MASRHKDPIQYQKRFYHKKYFEGWYYKQVSKDRKHTISFIPGVSFDKNKSSCFIQCIYRHEEKGLLVNNIDYPFEAFRVEKDPFSVHIYNNCFSMKDLELDLVSQELSVKGSIHLSNLSPIHKSLLHPNIMGFFSYIPFMECNHGLISMSHDLSGALTINDEIVDFTGGKGYIEKDWGSSFPSDYIWVQSNHFDNDAVSFFCSVANIPFGKFSFKGFICNLRVGNEEYRFATYNASRLIIDDCQNQSIHLMFKNSRHSLEIKGDLKDTKLLIAPKKGLMNHAIKEGLSGRIHVCLRDKKGQIILAAKSNHCGMEIVDKLIKL